MKRLILLILALSLLVGCKTVPRVTTRDAKTEAGIGTNPTLQLADYKQIASGLADSLRRELELPDSEKPPVLALGPIFVEGNYHVRVPQLQNFVRMELNRSKMFRLTSATNPDEMGGGNAKEIYKQMQFQHKSGMVDPSTAATFGKIVGAQYMLYGRIDVIEERHDQGMEVNYAVSMSVVNITTGIEEWIGEDSLAKTVRRR